jgi:hypothetical protein
MRVELRDPFGGVMASAELEVTPMADRIETERLAQELHRRFADKTLPLPADEAYSGPAYYAAVLP